VTTTESRIASVSAVEPTKWVVCPSLDIGGSEVDRAWQEVLRVWWEPRSLIERVTDEQPTFSEMIRPFSSEADALAWKDMREKSERLNTALCRDRRARNPIERIVLPGFSWPLLRTATAPIFPGARFAEWLRGEGITPARPENNPTAADIVAKMVQEAQLEIDDQVAPNCVLLDDAEFDETERHVSWKLPGQDPWPNEATSPFDAIALRATDFLLQFGPLPVEALVRVCGSWRLHWTVVQCACELASSATARKLGTDIRTCNEAGWQVRAALNRYASEMLRRNSSELAVLKTADKLSAGAPQPTVASAPIHQARTATAEPETKKQRAARRQAVVMPILHSKGWTPGKWATHAAVSKNSVYQYLDGTRRSITKENRQALADELGLKAEELPA
jgi:hypothetical protein